MKRTEELRRWNPDLIVATQTTTARFLADSRRNRRGIGNVPLAAVLTDFTANRFWSGGGIDLLLAPHRDIARQLSLRCPEARVETTGIPIGEAYRRPIGSTLARRRLGLDPLAPTVLIEGGSKGIGPIEEVSRQFLNRFPELQVLAVCGTNAPLFSRLGEIGGKGRLRAFSFEENPAALLSACDWVVGKAGGLTAAEALAIGRPLVFFGPLPGQERHNAEFLTYRGTAVQARSLEELLQTTRRFLNPTARRPYQERARKLGRPDAASRAVEALLGFIERPAPQKPRQERGTL